MKHLMLFATLLGASGSGFALDLAMPREAVDMGCPNCHAINHRVVGPAWMDVSRRYRAKRDDPDTFNALVKKVSRGGAGNWGSTPMVANDPTGTHQDKIRQLVKFVLGLSDRLPAQAPKK